MVIELKLNFKDTYVDENGNPENVPPMEFVHTLTSPEGFEITGGQIFVERPDTGDLERFSFRVDRDDNGNAALTIMEDPTEA